MNKKRGILLLLLLALITAILAGCTKDFDASGYTKAVLDVSYKNEIEDYIELTKSSKEEAETIFSKNMDATMSDFEALNLSDELEKSYRTLFEDLAKNVKYSVGEAVKDEDDNFTVKVSIEPITLFDDTYDEFQAKAQEYAENMTNDVMNGKAMPSDEEMQNEIYKIYYDILRSSMDAGIQYGEAQTVTVHVKQNENDVYGIPDEDIINMDDVMISQDVLSKGEDK